MKRTWTEVIEEIARTVLDVPICKEIVRRSGFKPSGTDTTPFGKYWWIPKGGKAGQVLWAYYQRMVVQTTELPGQSPSPNPSHNPFTSHFWAFRWVTTQRMLNESLATSDTFPSGYTGLGGGIPGGDESFHRFPSQIDGLQINDLEDASKYMMIQPKGGVRMAETPVVLHQLFVRNVPYHDLTPRESMFHKQLMLWESVPGGTQYLPYGVDWYIAKRDLTPREGQYLPREVCVHTCVVEGNPGGTLSISYSPGSTASPGAWTDLASVSLSNGPCRSPWVELPSGAEQDVWLAFRVSGSSGRLHLGPVTALMRWARRNPQ